MKIKEEEKWEDLYLFNYSLIHAFINVKRERAWSNTRAMKLEQICNCLPEDTWPFDTI